jgi:hypothetical protein
MRVDERKQKMGYGRNIRQCHDCGHCVVTEIKNNNVCGNWSSHKYYCGFGEFKTMKTATCKKEWKERDEKRV